MKKYIGNILASGPNYKVDDCFNKCISLSSIDNNFPTLIIGLENAKKNIGSDFNILKKKYNDGKLWWTFSKTERRVDHDKDIEDFKKYCINNIVDKLDYKLINVTNIDTFNKLRRTIVFVNNNVKKYYYVDNNKFIFLNDGKHIYGFSLNTASFYGFQKEKILNLLKRNTNNVRITNFYSIPNNIRRIVNDDIPSKMLMFRYF